MNIVSIGQKLDFLWIPRDILVMQLWSHPTCGFKTIGEDPKGLVFTLLHHQSWFIYWCENKAQHIIGKKWDLLFLWLTALHEQSSCVRIGRDGFRKAPHNAHVNISKNLVCSHRTFPTQCLCPSLENTRQLANLPYILEACGPFSLAM